MSSPLKFQTLFKFPGPSIPSLPYPPNGNNNKMIPPIPYSSLLPNIPITPKIADNHHCNVSLQNANPLNMAIPPLPSTFDVLSNKTATISPTKAIVNKVIRDDVQRSSHVTNANGTDTTTNTVAETTQMTEPELLNAIEKEKRNILLKTQKLSQLHDEYHVKLDGLKRILAKTKQKSILIEEIEQKSTNECRESLEMLLKKKQRVYDSYVLTQSMRLRDEQQLKLVEGQYKNLSSIVESLNKQLKNVINQYQLLCNKQNEQSNGEYMEHEQYHGQPDCSGAISNNQQFQEMLNDNRRLERQIKFLKHIIQKETERHKFNAI